MRKIPRKKIFIFFLAAAAFLAAAFGVYEIFRERRDFISLVGGAYENFSSAMKSVKAGDPTAAGESISRSIENADRLDNNSFSDIISFWSGDTSIASSIKELSGAAGQAAQMRNTFRSDLPIAVLTDGERARKIVRSLYSTLDKVISLGAAFRNQASAIDAFSGSSDYLAIQSDLERTRTALSAAVNFLSEDGEILFLLLDEREASPSGGMAAAYALFPIRGGQVITSEPVTISIPAKRDEIGSAANSFDFDSSSAAVAAALKLEKRPRAVIALNFSAFNRLLKTTGPVELPENKAVLDNNNAREIIIKDKNGNVFGKALSAIAKSLSYLPKERRVSFSEILYEALGDKDVQISFYDQTLSVSRNEGGFAAGDDYFAALASFSSAEKESLRGKAEVEIELRSDGSSDGKVTVTRVAPEAMKRGIVWSLVLPDRTEIGTVFGAVKGEESEVAAVASLRNGLRAIQYKVQGKSFSAEYERPPGSPDRYRFVYERQPGADLGLALKITAPAGYVFQENGRGEYLYESDSPPQRLIIGLTIVRL